MALDLPSTIHVYWAAQTISLSHIRTRYLRSSICPLRNVCEWYLIHTRYTVITLTSTALSQRNSNFHCCTRHFFVCVCVFHRLNFRQKPATGSQHSKCCNSQEANFSKYVTPPIPISGNSNRLTVDAQ
jgi:hypothetical protein